MMVLLAHVFLLVGLEIKREIVARWIIYFLEKQIFLLPAALGDDHTGFDLYNL